MRAQAGVTGSRGQSDATMRLRASRAPDGERIPHTFRVLGKGSRTVGTFSAAGHLDDWKARISRAIEAGAAQPETFTVVAIDALGVELWRRDWTPVAA